jgi:Flp pilus assembly protein TadD
METLAKEAPDDAMLLNNLAWLYAQAGDPRALATAEKAASLAPASPLAADTLGWILVQKGETARGAALLEKAVAAGPATPAMRYHLAVALSRSGKTAEARRIVGERLQSKARFDDREAAQQLLATLGG